MKGAAQPPSNHNELQFFTDDNPACKCWSSVFHLKACWLVKEFGGFKELSKIYVGVCVTGLGAMIHCCTHLSIVPIHHRAARSACPAVTDRWSITLTTSPSAFMVCVSVLVSSNIQYVWLTLSVVWGKTRRPSASRMHASIRSTLPWLRGLSPTGQTLCSFVVCVCPVDGGGQVRRRILTCTPKIPAAELFVPTEWMSSLYIPLPDGGWWSTRGKKEDIFKLLFRASTQSCCGLGCVGWCRCVYECVCTPCRGWVDSHGGAGCVIPSPALGLEEPLRWSFCSRTFGIDLVSGFTSCVEVQILCATVCLLIWLVFPVVVFPVLFCSPVLLCLLTSCSLCPALISLTCLTDLSSLCAGLAVAHLHHSLPG